MPNVFFLRHSSKLITRKTLYSRHIFSLDQMRYTTYSDRNILIKTGKWSSEGGKRQAESFSVLTLKDTMMPFEGQLDIILDNIGKVVEKGGVPTFIRFFLSDPVNQAPMVRKRIAFGCAVSIIGQEPLNGTKISAMVWCRKDARLSRLGDNVCEVRSGNVDEIWFTGGVSVKHADSFGQTVSVMDGLASKYEKLGLMLSVNCMRTWLYVQNIDENYKGMVDGRNKVFDRQGLKGDHHYIASTGIEGRTDNPAEKVMLDAVAYSGPGVSARYLMGGTHLNRTSEYGVRFERGTLVGFGDRNYVFISGTASIDNKGKILYEGDIVRQTERMIENVEVLLKEAGCGFDQVGSMIVYLRDPADYAVVNRIFNARFPKCPRVMVRGSVCRPGWLVEMECIAIY